jgi:hypothetical protein
VLEAIGRFGGRSTDEMRVFFRIGSRGMDVIETLIAVEIEIEARRLDHPAGERNMEIGVEIDLEVEAEMQR